MIVFTLGKDSFIYQCLPSETSILIMRVPVLGIRGEASNPSLTLTSVNKRLRERIMNNPAPKGYNLLFKGEEDCLS